MSKVIRIQQANIIKFNSMIAYFNVNGQVCIARRKKMHSRGACRESTFPVKVFVASIRPVKQVLQTV